MVNLPTIIPTKLSSLKAIVRSLVIFILIAALATKQPLNILLTFLFHRPTLRPLYSNPT